MARRVLGVMTALLFTFVLLARARQGPAPAAGSAYPDSLAPLPSAAAESGPAPPTSSRLQPLGAAARAEARQQLAAEPERHFLDSLVFGGDSLIRRWSAEGEWITLALLPEAAPPVTPEMLVEIQEALDQWNPAGVGLHVVAGTDTSGSAIVVRWVDRLDGQRAGRTNLLWEASGRVRRASVTLATHAPEGGPVLTTAARRAVAIHEIGHALGLPHSADSADVMFPVASVSLPTARDRFTLRLLYQMPVGWIGEAPRPGNGP